ncbi:MAG TPA: hypothetical protein VIJ88_00310 [Candidatus Paceibacterota bacterium]
MNNFKLLRIIGILFISGIFLLPVISFAAGTGGPADASGTSGPASNSIVNNAVPPGQYQVKNPLGSNINSFCGLIKALLGAAIAIGIPIAVLFIVFAGFKFVLARGNSEALVSARQNFMWTVIGIGIFLGAWLLAMVIANTVNTISTGSTGQQAISCQ